LQHKIRSRNRQSLNGSTEYSLMFESIGQVTRQGLRRMLQKMIECSGDDISWDYLPYFENEQFAPNGLELTCGARFTAPLCRPHEVRATSGWTTCYVLVTNEKRDAFYFMGMRAFDSSETPTSNPFFPKPKSRRSRFPTFFFLKVHTNWTPKLARKIRYIGLELTCGAAFTRRASHTARSAVRRPVEQTCYVAVANEKRDGFCFGMRTFDSFRNRWATHSH